MSDRKQPTPGLRLERLDDGSIVLVMGNKLAPYMARDDQVEADVEHINAAIEAAELAVERATRKSTVQQAGGAPTAGMRVDVDEGKEGSDKVYFVHTGRVTLEQATVDANYINWLIETDEKRREHLEKVQGRPEDLLVDLGDMTRVNLDNIALDATYESMTEDFVQTFNNVVLQGIPPINGVFSMSQAFAIVLGFALRANMPFEIAKALITQVMKSATAASQMVRVITQHRSGNA